MDEFETQDITDFIKAFNALEKDQEEDSGGQTLTYHDFLKAYNANHSGYHACAAAQNGMVVGVAIISGYDGRLMASLRTESLTWHFEDSVFRYDELNLMAKLAATLPGLRGEIKNERISYPEKWHASRPDRHHQENQRRNNDNSNM